MAFDMVVAAIAAGCLGLVLRFAGYAFVPELSQARFVLVALSWVCISLMLLSAGIAVYLYGYHPWAVGTLGLGVCAAIKAAMALRLSANRLNDGAREPGASGPSL
jgi:hypothetical protein